MRTCIKGADSWGGPPTYCACAKCQERRDAERAVLEAAEQWHTIRNSDNEEHWRQLDMAYSDLNAAVTRMLKARGGA